ncbi:MAG: hypothetical protein KBD47_02365 [Candidatus Pacebacteria bacterium]|nr:hypothetical protein [Candidatus Paceibacterota bacterium]
MKKGMILVNALVFGGIAIVIVTSLVMWGSTVLQASRHVVDREQAFHIAEAGIDYYRWHLAHASTDYYDGNASTTSPGPYTHPFKDKDGNTIGSFSLTITPPPSGSTVVKIKSVGTYYGTDSISRTIQATLAIPSLAKYAVAANAVMRFGAGTEVFGPIHSNDGIRFDGITHNLVTSAKTYYQDPDAPGPNRFGVYTQDSPTDPNYPAAVPSRPDVFMAGRQFPVPTIDFVGMTTDLSQIKSKAQSDGRYFAPSGSQGYRILLKTNDTFDLYKVTALTSTPNGCSNSSNQDGWGIWSIKTQTFVGNYALPSNGLVFVEDHVWVEGTINTARLTIASARFPDVSANRTNIIVNNDLLYTNTDGTDSIALIAQNNFIVGLVSLNSLKIDAAVIAQNGFVGRYYYGTSCKISGTNYYARSDITLYGMIASNKRYGFAYTDGTGYTTRDIIYDGNLLYAPPPSFPLTSNQYQIISWDELR